MGIHSDSPTDSDHLCDYGCNAVLEECYGGNATCVKKAECTVCGAEYGALLNHIDEDFDHLCDFECGKSDMGAHSDSPTDSDHLCDYGCNETLEECYGGSAKCEEKAKCIVCNKEYGDALSHDWDSGEITTNPTCTKKGVKTFTCRRNSPHTRTENTDAAGHSYNGICDSDCNTCGEKRTPASHSDADENHICNVCGAELPREEPSTGTVIAIVIASVVTVTIGAFSIFWFAVRKKGFKDLIGIFKK